MSQADNYLRQILLKYQVPSGYGSPALRAFSQIQPVIQEWAGSFLKVLEFSGSFAKGTGALGVTDVDIFISLSSTTPESLEQIFNSLFYKAQTYNWSPRKQNVSIGVRVANARVDLVPGKVQQGYQNYHSLYKSKTGGWTQTNIKIHIDKVKSSGRVEEIRLAKIWRQLNGLDFPSFHLELAVIQALLGKQQGDLANNFFSVLEYFMISLPDVRFVDPANTNNIISEDTSSTAKQKISAAAKVSKAKTTWGQIVW